MLMLVVGAIVQYFSTSGASSNQVYDLKAVEVLKSEANKLVAIYISGVTSLSNEFTDNSPLPDNIFLFKYNSSTSKIDLPTSTIFHVYYGDYNNEGYTIPIGDDSTAVGSKNTIDNYHSYYETAFDNNYTSLSDNEKRDIDLRTFTYCTVDINSSTNVNDTTPFQADVSMVVIDDMGSPVDPEDDLLGYVGWWVEDISGLKKITLALQYWYPGTDWRSVDPEVIVLETTVF